MRMTGMRGSSARCGQQVPAVQAGHHHVPYEQIGEGFVKERECGMSIRSRLNCVAFVSQESGKNFEDSRFVFHNQDATHTIALGSAPVLPRLCLPGSQNLGQFRRGIDVALNLGQDLVDERGTNASLLELQSQRPDAQFGGRQAVDEVMGLAHCYVRRIRLVGHHVLPDEVRSAF